VKSRLRLLLIAEGAAGVDTLRMLAGTGHEIVAVLTRGAGPGAAGATVAGVAARLGLWTCSAAEARDRAFADFIRREQVELLLNVEGPYVLPEEVVAAPLIGSFNLHPGPLPRYAGLNVPSWAIYHGEESHAVTLHWMDRGIDTGPLAYVSEFPIDGDETGLTLSGKCVRAGLPLVSDLLSAASRREIPRKPQPATVRRYYGREVPHEGRLIWTESAARLVGFIRASDYAPFPSPWRSPRAYIGGRELAVLKATLTGERSGEPAGTVGPRVGSEVLVAARDQWVRVQRVQVGSSIFSAAEALRTGERFALPTAITPAPAGL
jgi:UDP-4-amino-4-deoxy-L-arabinose formyltransferase/UDP-glucuronic acid dehydrogenase (UDP-4-keto-hexauronic acid decarboxylating)